MKKFHLQFGCLLLVSVLVVLLLMSRTSGVVLDWDGSIGNWDTDASWLPSGTEPTASDDPRIDAGEVTVNRAGEVARNLYVGFDNTTGVLTIDAGGELANAASLIGFNASGVGSATVAGVGATWTNASVLSVGQAGIGSMIVEAGGAVTSAAGRIGADTGSSGFATVRYAGSTWTNTSNLTIGDRGSGTLSVVTGGAVSNTLGLLGNDPGSTGSATVSGTGSTWTNSANLAVGQRGSGTLLVRAGGVVTSSIGYISQSTGSTGVATVTDTGSSWTTGNLFVGQATSGTLNVEAGGSVSSNIGYIGRNSGSTGVATVTGAGSSWTNSAVLYVGYQGAGTLNIEAGGTVTNTDGVLGALWGASTGTATVTGAGSTWRNLSDLSVGGIGTGVLNIADGGTVEAQGFNIGARGTLNWTDGTIRINGGSHNGLVTASSPFGLGNASGENQILELVGSDLNHNAELNVGNVGSGTLRVEAAGAVTNTTGRIGNSAGSTGAVTISGAGTTWTNSVDLYVGDFGDGTLTIEAGGAVTSTVGMIGRNPGSTGTATVTGAGSTWTNSSGLYVGGNDVQFGGTGNLNVLDSAALNVTGPFTIWSAGAVTLDGGSITANDGLDNSFGGTFDHIDGTLTVAGALFAPNLGGDYAIDGSAPADRPELILAAGAYAGVDGLYIGDTHQGELTLAGGAMVSTAGHLAHNSGSTGTATVTGAGSTWINSFGLYVGGGDVSAGGTGTLSVLNDATVTVGGPMKIWNAGTVTLDGGSITANGGLDNSVGGVFNHTEGTLTVTGGAFAPNAGGASDDYTVDGAGSPNVVLGAGATAAIGRDLVVGNTAVGALRVEAGATVTNRFGYIGADTGTGSVTVTGAVSSWTNSGTLFVGAELTSGNGALNIEAGGAVSNTIGYIARGSGSTSTATVTGNGSDWTNSGELYVAVSGNGTLTIADGGAVSNTAGVLGDLSGSTGNATVTGGGSNWTNSAGLFVGHSGEGTLTIAEGGAVTGGDGWVGKLSGSTGTVTVTGAGSTWTNSGSSLVLGDFGSATLNVEVGGVVINNLGVIGNQPSSNGAASVTGAGSTWTNTGELHVGNSGTATLQIESGGAVSNTNGMIGRMVASTGTATVTGVGSTWTNAGALYVGGDDLQSRGTGDLSVLDGSALNVTGPITIWSTGTVTLDGGSINANGGMDNSDGGTFDHTDGTLTVTGGAFAPNAGGNYTIDGDIPADRPKLVLGMGASAAISGDLFVGDNNHGEMTLSGGAVTGSAGNIGYGSGSTGIVTVSGAGSSCGLSSLLYVGFAGSGTLNVEAGGVVSNTTGVLGNNPGKTGTATVTGAGSAWTNSDSLYIGLDGIGVLTIADGGAVTNANGFVANVAGSTGTATVTGAGSTWTNVDDRLSVGQAGNGTLNVEAGGVVTSADGYLGRHANSTGSATITGAGSMWTNSNHLYVGNSGSGTLDVEAGGGVSNVNGYLGNNANSTGTATVTGAGSMWTNAGDLSVGGSGTGTLNVLDNGLVTVGGSTTIGALGAINVDGGQLDFGTMSLDDYLAINGINGSLAGDVVITGVNDLSALQANLSSHAGMDVTDVNAFNEGLLYGSGVVPTGLGNSVAGQVQVTSGERMIFAGAMTNAGTVSAFGGQYVFEGATVNQAGGTINGRGQFIANGGWTNDGAMNFSGGFADVVGNVDVTTNGSVITSGGGVTTFFDNVVHNGVEIRTAPGSQTVIFGVASGDGPFTSTGLVRFEGGYSPGNSPAEINLGGAVQFGADNMLVIELGGTTRGSEYDALNIAGTLDMDGLLDLQVINDYVPVLGDEMDIVVAAGGFTGRFDSITNVVQPGGLGLALRYGHDVNQIDVRATRRGDTDFDNDVDTLDLTKAIIGFTGAGGSGNAWVNGDFDGDGDTDTVDLTTGIIAFTGAQAGNAGVPDLVYDPATGNVTIDADGADMISFSLQGGPFSPADFGDLPAGLTDNIAAQIGWTSFNLFSGLTGTADLGAILPTGLTLPQLETMLTTASYGLALSGGGGGGRLDIIIPEPASIVLIGIGALPMVRRSIRKRWSS